jgi:hypothetical protein
VSRRGAAADRLQLYRRASRALNRFCGRWTLPFCADCIEVTARHHRGDPRADVELLEGLFPGCCHAGVGDALWAPGCGDEGRFPDDLRDEMLRARGTASEDREPARYKVRERSTRLLVDGIACVHLVGGACALGELKSPLCLCYVCDPVRAAIASSAGGAVPGEDEDDFCGSRDVLQAIVGAPLADAEAAVERLERDLGELDAALEQARARSGRTPYQLWARGAESAA